MVEGFLIGDEIGSKQFQSSADDAGSRPAEPSGHGGGGIVAQSLGIPDRKKEEVKGPSVGRTALKMLIRDQAVVDPTPLQGELASPLRLG